MERSHGREFLAMSGAPIQKTASKPAPLSPSEVTGVPQLQLSIFWRQFNPAFSKLLAR